MEKKKGGVTIPIWAISIFISLLFTLMSFTIAFSSGVQEVKSDVKTNRIHIDDRRTELESCQINFSDQLEKKANKETVDLIYESQIRMEGKLDDYISTH